MKIMKNRCLGSLNQYRANKEIYNIALQFFNN